MRKQLKLTLDMPVALAMQKYLQQFLEDIRQSAELVCDEKEEVSAKGVHDLRVSIRKVLAVLDHLGLWVDDDWKRRYKKGFSSYLRKMGQLRDLDVLALHMSAEVEQGLAESAWLERINKKRSKLRTKTKQMLKDKSFLKWLAERSMLLGSEKAIKKVYLPMCGDDGNLQLYVLGDVLPAVVYQTAAELSVYQQALPPLSRLTESLADDPVLISSWDDHSAELMHALRKTTKHSRYMLENLTSVEGISNKNLLKQLRELQDCLGIWHDAWLACEWGWRQAEKEPDNQKLVQWLSRKQAEKQAARVCFDKLWPHMTMAQMHPSLRSMLDELYK